MSAAAGRDYSEDQLPGRDRRGIVRRVCVRCGSRRSDSMAAATEARATESAAEVGAMKRKRIYHRWRYYERPEGGTIRECLVCGLVLRLARAAPGRGFTWAAWLGATWQRYAVVPACENGAYGDPPRELVRLRR